jgi:putative sterol carrier protein
MAEELKGMMDEALKQEKIIGSGLPTKIAEKIATVEASDLAKVMGDVLDKAPQILDKVKPELETVDVEELSAFIPKFIPPLMEKMQGFEKEDIEPALPKMSENIPKIMPTMMDLMDRVLAADEELKSELEGSEDVSINVEAGTLMSMNMSIKGGKMGMSTELADDADMTMKIPENIMMDLMTGTGDAMSAFMGGDVEMEGDMSKAMGMMPLMTTFGEKFGIEMM